MLEFLAFTAISAFAVMSPGPDLLVVAKNSINSSKRYAYATAAGVTVGVCLHMLLVVLGLVVLFKQVPALFHYLKYLGAGYLLYLGGKLLLSRGTANNYPMSENHAQQIRKAFLEGFLTHLLNLKAMLFYAALFSVIIKPSSSHLLQSLYAFEMCLITLSWFFSMAYLINKLGTQRISLKWQKLLHTVMGSLLVLFGVGLGFIKL